MCSGEKMLFTIEDERKIYKDKASVFEMATKINSIHKMINLSGNTFYSDAFEAVLDRMRHGVKKLVFSRIFAALPYKELLSSLELIGEIISPDELEELDLSENAISAVLPEKFFNFITKCQKLRILKINNCGFGPIGAKNLANALSQIENKNNLEYVDISKNKLDYGASEIGKVLSQFNNLHTVKIQYNTIPRETMDDFINSFRNHKLKNIDLRDNFISVEGCKKLGKWFSVWTNELRMGDCLIDDEGLEAFIEGVKFQKEILASSKEKIEIEKTEMKTETARKILDISYNDLTQESIEILEKNFNFFNVHELMIFGNYFKDFTRLDNLISDKSGVLITVDPDDIPSDTVSDTLIKKFEEIL